MLSGMPRGWASAKNGSASIRLLSFFILFLFCSQSLGPSGITADSDDDDDDDDDLVWMPNRVVGVNAAVSV